MSTTITIGHPSKRSGDKTTKKIHAHDEEFVHAVCALANTQGGSIIVRATNENERFSDKDVDDISRRLEQKTHDVFGKRTARKTMRLEKVTGGLEPSELIYNVQAWSRSLQPCTISYNLYEATETQLIQFVKEATMESEENIITFTEKIRTPKEFEFGSHYRCFAFGEVVPLRESKDTELKCLKDKNSKSCNLVTRMDGNNLTSYVSAFANGDGGHIYYGIKNQNGSNCVKGEVVKNQDKIVSGVKKIIKKMLWPQEHGEPTRGKHWEIFFEPVLGVDENDEPRFIIVISVAPSSRAVFTEVPESYHVVDGKVERLNYSEWEKRLRQHLISNRPPIVEIPKRVKRTDWSSKEARDTHVTILRDLIHLRNQGGDQAFFTRISELRQTTDHNGNVEIILQQQEAAYYFRKDDLEKAERLLVENERYLPTSPEANIYEFRRLYWLCVIKRSQGELVESDRLSTVAMQHAETLPHMLTEAWLLVNKGKKLEIDIATRYNKGELQDYERLKKECINVYYNALGKADVAEDAKSGIVDLKQRVHFSLARIFLGCFQNQEEITRTVDWREDDLKEAEKMLGKVEFWRKHQGYTMTLLCKCEYLMTRCEQEIRNWQRFGNLVYLEEAGEYSAKALKIAEQNDFKRHCCYANEQHAYLKGFQVKS